MSFCSPDFSIPKQQSTVTKLSDTFSSDVDINDFISQFNKKVGVSTESLNEVLEIVDVLVRGQVTQGIATEGDEFNESKEKLKEKIKKLKNKKHDLINKLQKSESINDSLQNENDKYKIDNQKNDEIISILQKKLDNANHEIEDLKKADVNSSESKKILNDCLVNFGDLVQSQIDDSSVMLKQRNELIKIINKQNNALQEYEKYLFDTLEINKRLKEQNNEAPKVIEKSSDLPMALSTVLRTAINLIPDEISTFKQISEEHNLSYIERINKIMITICNLLTKSNNEIKKMNEDKNNLNIKLKDFQEKGLRILSMFGEEIKFIQTITHSNDLQSCIFYRPETSTTIQLDNDTKNELIRRCAKINKYIEETITQFSIDEISDIFSHYESIKPTEIFNLLSADKLETKIRDFMERMGSNESLEFNELFYMFAAQAFINDILQNHVMELRARYDLLLKDKKQRETGNEENDETIKSLKKIVKHYRNQQSKATQLLSKYFEISDDINIVSVTKKLINYIEENHNQPGIQTIQTQVSDIVSKKEALIKELSFQLKKTEDDISNISKAYKEKENSLNSQIEKLKADLNEKENNNNQTINEYESYKQSSDLEIKKYKEQLLKTKSLEKNLVKAMSKIEELKKCKKESKIRIDFLENLNKKSVEKSKELKNQYDIGIQQIKAKFEITQQENENLKSEKRNHLLTIDELTDKLNDSIISQKSNNLKLKTIEDKYEGQKQTLIMKYSTKIKAIENELNDKINLNNEEIMKNINLFIDNANKNLKLHLQFVQSSTFSLYNFLQNLSNQLQLKAHSQEIYENTVSDLFKVQKLLQLNESDEIFDPVNKIINENKSLNDKITEFQNQLEESSKRSETLCQEIRKSEEQIYSLRQWESWARRLYLIIFENSISTYSSNKLRLSLEETILSSISKRTLLIKLKSLRDQKELLVKYDKNILKQKTDLHLSWSSSISVVIFCYRLLKNSGCLIINNSSSSLNHSSSKFYSKAEKNKISSQSSSKYSIFNHV